MPGSPSPALPPLFKVIIEHDHDRPNLKAPVVDLSTFRHWLSRKVQLRIAAQNFIKRQRGNPGGASSN